MILKLPRLGLLEFPQKVGQKAPPVSYVKLMVGQSTSSQTVKLPGNVLLAFSYSHKYKIEQTLFLTSCPLRMGQSDEQLKLPFDILISR
jgi:hypothetical protein